MTSPAAAISTHNEQGKRIRLYPIPNPTTGVVEQLPNISSVIDVLQTWGLTDWKLRMAAVGIVARLDLQAAIGAATLMPGGRDRNRTILDAVDLAIDQGQILDPDRGYLANDFGTAIHLVTEQLDARPVDLMSLPASIAEHANRYAELLDAHGFDVVESEFTVYGAAGYGGTGDRIVRFAERLGGDAAALFDSIQLGTGSFVVDIKTGKVKTSAAMQLAALVNAETIYDAAESRHRPLPADLRRDVGFVLHLTAGAAELVPLDLRRAWPAFVGALAVKEFVDSDPLFAPLVPTPYRRDDPGEGVDGLGIASAPSPDSVLDQYETPLDLTTAIDTEARAIWMRDRLTVLADRGDQIAWPPGVPTFGEMREAGATHTAQQLESIGRALDAAEKEAGAPFPDVDPTNPQWQAVAADDPRVVEITRRYDALPADLRRFAATSARVAGARRFSLGAGTEACVATWCGILDAAEVEAAERAAKVANTVGVLTDLGFDSDALLAAVGNYVDAPTGWQTERLDDLADCATCDALTTSPTGSLYVDGKAVLARWSGMRRPLLAAAKTIAKSWSREPPTSIADALADPLMAAALYLVDVDPTEAA